MHDTYLAIQMDEILSRYLLILLLSLLHTERYCPDPLPPIDGLSDWDSVAFGGGNTLYGQLVTYSCGLGRKLKRNWIQNGTQMEDLVPSHGINCQWNKEWDPSDQVSSTLIIRQKNNFSL